MSKDHSLALQAYRNREVHVTSDPAVVYIESVLGCPETCVMCQSARSKPRQASVALLAKLEPYFPKLEVLGIHGGGEPLLGDLEYYVDQAVKHDLVVHMNTTGYYLTRKKADLLLKTRLSIRFSIHAGRPHTYWRIMGRDLDKVAERIGYLVHASRNAPKKHDLWFSYIVMKENVDETEDFLHLAHRCGIRNVRFMQLLPVQHTVRGVVMRDMNFRYLEQWNRAVVRQFQTRLPEYRKLATELGIFIETGSFPTERHGLSLHRLGVVFNKATRSVFGRTFFPLFRTRGQCAAPWVGQLMINQEGNVRLCCASSYSLGSLNDASLGDLWRSDDMREIRKCFRDGYCPRACAYCSGFDLSNYPHNAFPGSM